jgi:ParB-like chromosome segregation protein Spo0J
MPIDASHPRLSIDSIVVNREFRQRGVLETKSLEQSIARVGLIQPIVITRDLVLKAGERRLTACRNLGLADIPVVFFEDLDAIDARIIELEENVKREGLVWRDQVRATAEIHGLLQQRDPGWTMTETAEAVSLSLSTVSMYLRVDSEINDPRVQQATTVREAYGILTRRDQRAMGDALQELLEVTNEVAPLTERTPNGSEIGSGNNVGNGAGNGNSGLGNSALVDSALTDGIITADFLEWVNAYSGPKFNLLHCDFPYGVNLFAGAQGRGIEPTSGYADLPDVYYNLLEGLCANLQRLMSVSSHIMFWYSNRAEIQEKTLAIFHRLAPQVKFSRYPLIWFKSDNVGISSDSSREPRHVYESCLLGSIGNRQIMEIRADCYPCPTDKRLHPSTKPESMLKHFMTMLVDGNTSLLDPTCGSGAALRAAESLGARAVLGLEIDEKFAEPARQALRQSRQARAASRTLKQIQQQQQKELTNGK